jgi:putative acetyltransferase
MDDEYATPAALPMRIEIQREDLASPVALRLIRALDAELSRLYPEQGATHFRLDADEVAPERGGFFVAYVNGSPVGCGAVRQLDAETAEIKRMYVDPGMRRRGVGRAVLAALEREAARLGVRTVVLETGARQPEALRLYEATSFSPIPPFGEYVDSPLSICLGKRISL